MTLPASGTITFSQVSVETGNASNFSASMSWINANTKAGQTSNSLSGHYSQAWYQRNVDGNCNNGNCPSNCNCGDQNCANCLITGPVNCANCDARAWLQSNCNCACTYNCTTTTVTINCNCNCNCDCNCTCFLEGAMVLMADGSTKPIEQIRIGEQVAGRFGEPNTVIALDRPNLGVRPIVWINGEHAVTKDHPHFTETGPVCLDLDALKADMAVGEIKVIGEAGESKYCTYVGLTRTPVGVFREGSLLVHRDGLKRVESVAEVRMPADTRLCSLVLAGSHTMFVNGYLVTGFANDIDFDYATWRPIAAETPSC